MGTPEIVKLLKKRFFGNVIKVAYLEGKENLHEDFQDIDDELMISHAKAYIVKVYEEMEDKEEKDQFMDILQDSLMNVTIIYGLVDEFIKSVNSLRSKIGERVHKDVVESIKELENYKNTDIYKKLSKNNNMIANIIKDYHGYFTFNELKERCHDEPRGGELYHEYIISEEELKIIEATKNYPQPNQMAHLIYDTRKNNEYHCNHEIKDEKEVLKNLLVSTKKDTPRFDIIFDDGTIVCYNEGDIRIRPYNFKQILRYTKLYFVKHYDEMLDVYQNLDTSFLFSFGIESESDIEINKEPDSKEIGRQMIINSFVWILTMFIDYEEVYTKKTIEESKKGLVKIKEIAKKYDF